MKIFIDIDDTRTLSIPTTGEWTMASLRQGPSRRSSVSYPWHSMREGDAFLVKTKDERRSARSSLTYYLSKRGAANPSKERPDCHLDQGPWRMGSAILPRGQGYVCTLERGEGPEEPPVPVTKAKQRATIKRWLLDWRKALSLAEGMEDYRVLVWASDKGVAIVSKKTGEWVWANKEAKERKKKES